MSNAVSHSLTLNRVKLSVAEPVDEQRRRQLQYRVSSALEQVSIYPTMPPQVILVVKHLTDPKPGKLLSSQTWQGLRTWEQATQSALTACWQRACRPAQEAVPATANSVWFADQAEWLACLSMDLWRGQAADRWWWQTTLQQQRATSLTETLATLWQQQAQWFPAMVQLLLVSDPDDLIAMVRDFSPEQSQNTLAVVAQTYGLTLSRSPQGWVNLLRSDLPEGLTARLGTLPTMAQGLLTLGCALPNALPKLRQHTHHDDAATLTPKSPADGMPASTSDAAEENSSQQPDGQEADAVAEQTTNKRSSRPLGPRIVAMETTSLNIAANDMPSASQLDAVPEDALPEIAYELPETGVATGFGGLWYLVHVLVGLEWPGMEEGISPWQQLLSLAQGLLPGAAPDPVWELLTELAGEPMPKAQLTQWQQTTLALARDYLAARLDAADGIARYLQEPATLYYTRTHIDLVFGLEQIRFDVRVAGLDQDPGWVSELAHVIAFHYE